MRTWSHALLYAIEHQRDCLLKKLLPINPEVNAGMGNPPIGFIIDGDSNTLSPDARWLWRSSGAFLLHLWLRRRGWNRHRISCDVQAKVERFFHASAPTM